MSNEAHATDFASHLGPKVAALCRFLFRLTTNETYGCVTIKLERGAVVSVRLEQSIKPDELDDVRLAK